MCPVMNRMRATISKMPTRVQTTSFRIWSLLNELRAGPSKDDIAREDLRHGLSRIEDVGSSFLLSLRRRAVGDLLR